MPNASTVSAVPNPPRWVIAHNQPPLSTAVTAAPICGTKRRSSWAAPVRAMAKVKPAHPTTERTCRHTATIRLTCTGLLRWRDRVLDLHIVYPISPQASHDAQTLFEPGKNGGGRPHAQRHHRRRLGPVGRTRPRRAVLAGERRQE